MINTLPAIQDLSVVIYILEIKSICITIDPNANHQEHSLNNNTWSKNENWKQHFDNEEKRKEHYFTNA